MRLSLGSTNREPDPTTLTEDMGDKISEASVSQGTGTVQAAIETLYCKKHFGTFYGLEVGSPVTFLLTACHIWPLVAQSRRILSQADATLRSRSRRAFDVSACAAGVRVEHEVATRTIVDRKELFGPCPTSQKRRSRTTLRCG